MRFLPSDQEFFTMFDQLAQRLTAAAKLLNQLFLDPARLDELTTEIKSVEHEADGLTHEIIERIDKTFVTPIDREDIHLLASRLDNVIDLLDGAARRAQVFRITESRPAAPRLTGVLMRAGDAIQAAVSNVKRSRLVATHAQEIKRLEEEGDAIYHEALAELFGGSPDPLEVIKWKDLFDKLEDAIDECEDVGNVLESVSLKHS